MYFADRTALTAAGDDTGADTDGIYPANLQQREQRAACRSYDEHQEFCITQAGFFMENNNTAVKDNPEAYFSQFYMFIDTAAGATRLVAETSIAQGLSSNTTDVIVVRVNIDRIKNPSDDSTASIPDGIDTYTATANGTPGSIFECVAANGVSPLMGQALTQRPVSFRWPQSPLLLRPPIPR